MGARALGQAPEVQVGPLQVGAVGVQSDGIALGGLEIHLPGLGVHPQHPAHVPGTGGDLALDPAQGVVPVQVLVAAAGRPPEEAAVLEEHRKRQPIDPPAAALLPHQGLPRVPLEPHTLQPGLGAVLVIGHEPAGGIPAHGDNDRFIIGMGIFHPGKAAVQVHHPQPGHRVGLPRARIGLEQGGGRLGPVVLDGDAGDVGFIQADEGDAPGVRGPPEPLGPLAGKDLLLVDPVQAAVQVVRPASGGEPGLPAGGQVRHHQVVALQVGHQGAVGAEGGRLLEARGAGHQPGADPARIHQVQVLARGHQEGVTGRVPDEGRAPGGSGARLVQPRPRQGSHELGLVHPGAGLPPGRGQAGETLDPVPLLPLFHQGAVRPPPEGDARLVHVGHLPYRVEQALHGQVAGALGGAAQAHEQAGHEPEEQGGTSHGSSRGLSAQEGRQLQHYPPYRRWPCHRTNLAM